MEKNGLLYSFIYYQVMQCSYTSNFQQIYQVHLLFDGYLLWLWIH